MKAGMGNAKKKKKTTTPNNLQKCWICSHEYGERNSDRHMHSYTHHKAIEELRGSTPVAHKCRACDVSVMGLEKYQEHIAEDKHKENLIELQCKTRKKQNLTVNHNTKRDVEVHTPYSQKKMRHQKCSVCYHSFLVQELDKHMHSFIHRQTIEKLKGCEQLQKCWACDQSMMGLQEFKKHIKTDYHKHMMLILTANRSDDRKSTVDYGEEFDEELKALCAERERLKIKKKEEKMLKLKRAKTKAAKQKAPQIKLIAKVGDDFTSDQLPVKCQLFSSWEDQQKISTSRPDPTTLKRRQQSMDNFNGPLVKRPCPPSEISAHVSGEPMCAPEAVQTKISTLLKTLRKSLDSQDVNVCSEENAESHMERVVRQTCESNRKKELKGETKFNKKHKKQDRAKEYVSSHSSRKSREDPCSHHAFYTLRNSQQDQINTNRQQEQCMSREKINGQEASVASPSSVTSMAEKIGRFQSQTTATRNVNVCQILDVGGNDSLWNDADTARRRKNGYNAETSQEDLDFHQIISYKPRKEQDISKTTHQNPETTLRQNKVNALMTLCSREEELSDSFRNVGDQLFQAYATLHTAYTEVQHLLTAKQEVTSEMSSLRAKRIQLLQDMIE